MSRIRPTTLSKTEQLARFLRRHPNQWIDGKVLPAVAGQYAWRTRVSELRLAGMDIRNRQMRFRGQDGQVYTVSEYRLVAS